MKRIKIIAEAGVNHNGSLELAKDLVDVAADAGADSVKFQTFSADDMVIRKAEKASYQKRNGTLDESQYLMLKRLELDHNDHPELIEHCRNREIEFLSTPFDHSSIDFLSELGMTVFKIPSGEITNIPYLRHVAQAADEVILSTGMSTLGEVETALDVLIKAGVPRERIIVLHATTEYPCPKQEVNLKAMITLRRAFDVAAGYSDHTEGIEIPIAAAALGAAVIEKHFTLDRSLPGPDHRASLEPRELNAMVKAVRHVEVALGTGRKRVTESEEKNLSIARKSIVAAKPIATGEPFTVENLAVKRPGTGISPIRWDEIIGRTAMRDFDADEFIEL